MANAGGPDPFQVTRRFDPFGDHLGADAFKEIMEIPQEARIDTPGKMGQRHIELGKRRTYLQSAADAVIARTDVVNGQRKAGLRQSLKGAR